MRDVLLLLSTILYDLEFKEYRYLMRECEKGCQKAVATGNIKTSIFNLQYLSHFLHGFLCNKHEQKHCKNLSNEYLSKNAFLMIYFTYL